MVARAHDRVQETNDPTAHAVVVALRETARKLGAVRLADATIFATLEPCAMCVGALLESDVEALVYALAERRDGAAGTVIQLAQHESPAAPDQGRQRHPPRRGRGAVRRRVRRVRRLTGPARTSAAGGLDRRGLVSSPRRGVRVVDGAALEKRCAKAPRVRIPPSPPQTVVSARPMPASARPARSLTHRRMRIRLVRAPGRGRLVDYGAALEMRFGATRRGFESRPLRHSPSSASAARGILAGPC